MNKPVKRFIDCEELRNELIKNPSSDKVGLLLMKFPSHMLITDQFRGYSQSTKDEMYSESLIQMIKAIPKLDLSQPAPKIFAYLNLTCYRAFLQILRKYYKNRNMMRDLLEKQLFDEGKSQKQINEILNKNEEN